MTTIRLVIPTAVTLTANQRLHWRAKAERAATLRQLAAAAKRQQANGVMLETLAHCSASFKFRDTRRRDVLNWADTVKPCIDGFVDAGLLPDDDGTHLIGPDLRQGIDRNLPVRNIAITFTFTPL